MPPSPPKKKSKTWLWILIALIIGLVIGYAAHTPGSQSASDSTVASAQATTQATSQPTQAPTQPAVTPTPTLTPKWTTVQTITGNGNKKTGVFSTPNDWKIVWSCNPSSFDNIQYNLSVDVYGSDNSIVDLGAINILCKPKNTTGETEEHQGGQVYLDIQSEGDWKIQVQELK
jgi:hypothetical protein